MVSHTHTHTHTHIYICIIVFVWCDSCCLETWNNIWFKHLLGKNLNTKYFFILCFIQNYQTSWETLMSICQKQTFINFNFRMGQSSPTPTHPTPKKVQLEPDKLDTSFSELAAKKPSLATAQSCNFLLFMHNKMYSPGREAFFSSNDAPLASRKRWRFLAGRDVLH